MIALLARAAETLRRVGGRAAPGYAREATSLADEIDGALVRSTPTCDLDGVERAECGAFRALGGCDACPAPRTKP